MRTGMLSYSRARTAGSAGRNRPAGIEMLDERPRRGLPSRHEVDQRFLVIMDDGVEIRGRMDAEGKTEVKLSSGGTVGFPDLSEAAAG